MSGRSSTGSPKPPKRTFGRTLGPGERGSMTTDSRQQLTGDRLYETIEEVSAQLYKRSLTDLPPDVRRAVDTAFAAEEGRQARMMLRIIQRAVETSDRTDLIVCQDTGIPVYFVGIGTEIEINGHRLIEALGRGIELATKRYHLRSSIVHPITRENRQTSTGREIPVIHLEFLDGADYLDLLLLPKGSGSENMSFVKMLTPADGLTGVKRFVLDCVVQAGANPCPPTIVGVGLGGSFDKCAELAKRAITRPVGEPHPE